MQLSLSGLTAWQCRREKANHSMNPKPKAEASYAAGSATITYSYEESNEED
jgi:hypothetical protein